MKQGQGKKKASLNHLYNEKSPYLLQHVENPVDWFPWGDEAFKKATDEDKPIFLSIGYATCHWCHVMAHESFEDDEVGRLLNQYFIAIKVDREERPDIDHIYMSVCQALTGRGGWPLSIFMTPEGKPFYAGTYFPKDSRMGMPGLMDILPKLGALWQEDRGRLLSAADKSTQAIQPKEKSSSAEGVPDESTLNTGYVQLARSFDPKWGGFGNAPKFPTPHHLNYLLRQYRRQEDSSSLDMVKKTLDAMRNGGIFDQIGFGFHRYSVDEKWLVPHFEKMLYDQALLVMAYVEAYQVTGEERYAKTVRQIIAYVLRDMTSPEGGFYSAEDADSEGREGTFYLWTPQEVKKILGNKLGELFCRFYNITEAGNFEEKKSIPNIRIPADVFAKQERIELEELERLLEEAREKIFSVRRGRVHPLKDDKVLTSWNGLMIAALAKAYRVLGEVSYLDAGQKAASFIMKELKQPDGKLFRRFRQGHIAYSGYLDDYAFLVWGLIELYEAAFDCTSLNQAIDLTEKMIELFWDDSDGGFYFSGTTNEVLIAKSKDAYDGAMPSGNSVSALNLLRLSRMTGNIELEKKAEELFKSFSQNISAHPIGYSHFLSALDFMIGPSSEIVIAGDPNFEATREMVSLVHKTFLPNKVVLLNPSGEEGKRISKLSSFVEGLLSIDQKPTVYICEEYSCKAPITSLEGLREALGSLPVENAGIQ